MLPKIHFALRTADNYLMEQTRKSHSEKPQVTEEDAPTPSKTSPEIEAHKQHSDELLDEIDALLEENAEQFVKEYVQRGGQ